MIVKTEVLKIKLMEMIPEEVTEYVGNIINLKLYDAHFLAYKIAEENGNEEAFEAFNNFCQINFYYFAEDCESPMRGL